MKNEADGLAGLLTLFILGASFFHKAIRTHRRMRQIEDTPRSKVASAAQGLVELQGFAWPLESCAQTVQQKQAVFYEFKLQKLKKKSGKNKGSEWVTVFTKSHKPNFLLVDPTGTAMIDPADAELTMTSSIQKQWHKLNETEKNYVLSEVLTESVAGFPPGKILGGLFSSSFRIVENFILRGSPVHASGDFRTDARMVEPIQAKGLSRFCDMIFDRNSRSEKNVSNLLDKNKDGKVTHQESLDGYVFAADTALQRTQLDDLQERDFQVHGTMRKSDQHGLFLAAALEKHLIGDMKYKPALFLAGGSVAMAIAIVALAMKFGFHPETWTRFQDWTQASADSSPAREPAKTLDPSELHQKCVDNSMTACVMLLNHRNEFELQPAHLQYYSAQACKLGAKDFCK